MLVMDLDGNLLPFEKQRVRCSELQARLLPSRNVLIVENETCTHLLPRLADIIAILGSGFDLGWTSADWLAERRVGYWGDIDTRGLTFLAQARHNQRNLIPLLMNEQTFVANDSVAVAERTLASNLPPLELTASEQDLFLRLTSLPQGRLEQEFLSPDTVHHAITIFTKG